MPKFKKTKSHGKPSINKDAYKSSASAIGIDIEAYGPRRPRPVMVYKIYCHYKRTLDHSKYPWATDSVYSDDYYIDANTAYAVCDRLEKMYPKWIFIGVGVFVTPPVLSIDKPTLPKNIIYDIDDNEVKLLNRISNADKRNTDKHKQQILEDAGLSVSEENSDINKQVPPSSTKSKKCTKKPV